MFPEVLDDYITDENVVRAIDVFVDGLDLSSLGFKVEPAETGRPAYHPGIMPKLYIYGYLNRTHSSRHLEREANRNGELMWLLGRLTPDFKTTADFRQNNTKGIVRVSREFVLICRKLDLFSDSLIADEPACACIQHKTSDADYGLKGTKYKSNAGITSLFCSQMSDERLHEKPMSVS